MDLQSVCAPADGAKLWLPASAQVDAHSCICLLACFALESLTRVFALPQQLASIAVLMVLQQRLVPVDLDLWSLDGSACARRVRPAAPLQMNPPAFKAASKRNCAAATAHMAMVEARSLLAATTCLV